MTISHDPSPRAPGDYEEELFELLKQGEDTNPATSIETNEEASTVGTNDLYKEPLVRESKNIDAPWGEPGPQQSGRQEPFHNSSGVWSGHQQTRFGTLNKTFSGYSGAAAADQAIIAQNFNNRDYETHSALLERTSKPEQGKPHTKAAHVRQPTLIEQVKQVVGRT